MTHMRQLAQLMKELENQLSICMRCGTCQSVCPLFSETGREADVARGKLALLDGLIAEMFDNPKGVSERLDRCLLCGSCAHNCPSGVNVLEIFIKARAIIAGVQGLTALKRVLLRGMLAHPHTFDRVVEWGIKCQTIFTKPANTSLGTSCARIMSPVLRERHFTPLAPVPFHRMYQHMNQPMTESTGKTTIKVAFFVGCLIDKLLPRIAQSVVKISKHHGVSLFIPDEQVCCGMPALSSGDTVAFEDLVRQNLEWLNREDIDYVVTACATCTATIRNLWPMMIQEETDAIQTIIKKIAGKTLDINQFLVSQMGVKEHPQPSDHHTVCVTYHDPCHLKKSLGVWMEPRTIIKANEHYRLKEMQEADWCCGMGGSFNLQHYELSVKIGKRKLNNIKASGCSIVATGCPACMVQITDMLSQSGETISVKHPIELYGETLEDHPE